MDDRWESEVIEYGAVNITGFRIVDTSRKYVREFLEGWRKLEPAVVPPNAPANAAAVMAQRDTISVSTVTLYVINRCGLKKKPVYRLFFNDE
jgi:hypothetical protein